MTLPNLSAKATLDVAPFRKGAQEILTDLRAIKDLSKQVGTIRITADLSAGKSAEAATRALTASLERVVPTDMQARIDRMFGGFDTGLGTARASSAAFEAQAATLRARIQELSNAVRITRAEFQAGIGEATPEETAALSASMRRLKADLESVGAEAKQTFGEWSNEAVKAANATRTAEATVAAANGQISRLGLASQVKLGASAALSQFGPQAGIAANGLMQLARASDTARLSNVFFEKQLTKANVSLSEGRKQVDLLSGAFNVMPNVTEEAFKVLLRNGYTLQQASEAMKLYAGSALAAGKDVGGAWDALAQDVQRGSTIMSNQYGITANIITSQNAYAKALKISSNALTDQQKVEGFLIALRKESSQELADAETILKGYAGSAGQANLELQRAGQEVGQNLMPLLTNGTRVLVGLLDAYNNLPAPVRNVTTILLASAVAVGLLATPVSSLVGLYRMLTGAATAAAVAENVQTAATVRGNAAAAIKRVLMMDVGVLYGKLNTLALLYNGSLASNAASMNVFTAATGRATIALKGFTGVLAMYAVAAAAAIGLGVYWADQVRGVTDLYAQIDAASQKSNDAIMARVKTLMASGTELDKARAKVLLLETMISDAQQGDLKGTNLLTGERIYSKPDEARIAKLQTDLVAAKANLQAYAFSAQMSGKAISALTDTQTKSLKEITAELDKRRSAFDFKVSLEGKTDLQQALAELGQSFDDLRQKAKDAFKADPNDPRLKQTLDSIQAEQNTQASNVRLGFAKQAADAAKKSALDVQAAEIEAMQEGAAKRAAQRQAEVAQIERDAQTEAKKYADFPAQRAQIESDARRVIAAKRRAWAAEDVALARQNAQTITEAENAARDAQIAGMADGRAKKEAVRAAELADLQASIAAKVAALAGDPETQQRVRAAGQDQVSGLLTQQAQARAQEQRDALAQVAEAQRAAREAQIAAVQDEAARTRAQREQEVADYQKSVQARLDALRGWPTQQQAVLVAAQQQKAALEAKWAQEDQTRAKEAAARIADAWLKAQDAQAQAAQAGREKQAAQFELDQARLIAALRDRAGQTLEIAAQNAVRIAEIEQQGTMRRAALAQQDAQAQYARELSTLRSTLDRALSNDKLSVGERKALWAGYYADLDRLAKQFQTDDIKRTQEAEQAQADALEKIRQARLALANLPVLQSQERVQELQQAKEISVSDSEILYLNQQISAEREKQLTTLRGELIGLGGVILTAEERQKVEGQIRGLQHDQALALKDQQAQQSALLQSTLDRLDAESAFAERMARTDADLLTARLNSLSTYQARVRVLDVQIAGEGRDQERNALIQTRLGVLEKIKQTQDTIDAMPGEAEQRRVAALQAQRGYALELAGLADSAVSKAAAGVANAEDGVRLAQQQVNLAKTQAEREEAITDLTAKRTAYLVAQHELTKARNDEENRALDIMEAQARAELQLRGLADDAVATAQVDLDVTRQKLNLLAQQLGRGGLTNTETLALQKQQVELTGQQAAQERTLTQARKDQAKLLSELADAQRNLNLELDGGNRRITPLQAALRGVADARAALARSEIEYGRALENSKPDQQKTATDNLTSAIKTQRDAVAALAAEYRNQITSMDSVQGAADRLKKVAYGDNGKAYDFNTEYQRLQAVQGRRDAAQRALVTALQGGNADLIAKAADELTKQEERYQKQADLMTKNGSQITRTGEQTTKRLADQVDALGIEFDREAVTVGQRAEIADREAQAILSFGGFVDRFAVAAGSLSTPGNQRVTISDLPPIRISEDAVRQLAQIMRPAPLASTPAVVPTTQPAPSYTTWNVDVTVNALPGMSPDAVADAAIRKLEDRARRTGRGC